MKPNGTFGLPVNGKRIEGSLPLKDNTSYRRIYLLKED
jgi:hypothetical protein